MAILEAIIGNVKTNLNEACTRGAIPNSERVLSVLAGSLLLGASLNRIVKHPTAGLAAVGMAAALLIRGATGKCPLKGILAPEEELEKMTIIEHRYFVK